MMPWKVDTKTGNLVVDLTDIDEYFNCTSMTIDRAELEEAMGIDALRSRVKNAEADLAVALESITAYSLSAAESEARANKAEADLASALLKVKMVKEVRASELKTTVHEVLRNAAQAQIDGVRDNGEAWDFLNERLRDAESRAVEMEADLNKVRELLKWIGCQAMAIVEHPDYKDFPDAAKDLHRHISEAAFGRLEDHSAFATKPK